MRETFWAFLPAFVQPYAWLLLATVAITVVRAGRMASTSTMTMFGCRGGVDSAAVF